MKRKTSVLIMTFFAVIFSLSVQAQQVVGVVVYVPTVYGTDDVYVDFYDDDTGLPVTLTSSVTVYYELNTWFWADDSYYSDVTHVYKTVVVPLGVSRFRIEQDLLLLETDTSWWNYEHGLAVEGFIERGINLYDMQ